MRLVYLIVALGCLLVAAPVFCQEDEPLLLLEDESESLDETEGADNSRCHVCHLNFAMEEIAVKHARQDIGCGDCHGDCDKHIDDESWASGGPGTPPGVMFPPEDIGPACRKCHASHDASETAMQARLRANSAAGESTKDAVCTDCHGKHRIKAELRHAWWDKRTGKPIKPAKPE